MVDLGWYTPDGRRVVYDRQTGDFLLGGKPVSRDSIRAYHAARQVAWRSLETHRWFESNFLEPAASLRRSARAAKSNDSWVVVLVIIVVAILGLWALGTAGTSIPSTVANGSGGASAVAPSPASSRGTVVSPLPGDANGDGKVIYPEIPPGANPSPQATGAHTEWNWVDGYYRSDGTFVQGHYRRTK